MFPEISQADLAAAEAAMEAARKGRPEGTGSADLVAAGAALVLSRGSPQLVDANVPLTFGNVLDRSGAIGARMRNALARCLHVDENGACAPGPPSASVNKVVADVAQQVSAMKIMAAAANPAFEGSLNEAQKQLASRAKEDSDFYWEMSAVMQGKFHKLSPEMSSAVEEALSMPQPASLAREMEAVGPVIDRVSADRDAARKLSFHPFSQVEDEGLDRIARLHTEGASTGAPKVDAAVRLSMLKFETLEDDMPEPAVHLAQARLLSRAGRFGNVSTAHMAASIVTDVAIMKEATRSLLRSPHPDPKLETLSAGAYDKLSEADQKFICSQLDMTRQVSAMETMDIAQSAKDKGIALNGPDRSMGAPRPEAGR